MCCFGNSALKHPIVNGLILHNFDLQVSVLSADVIAATSLVLSAGTQLASSI
jgi:hypothetical protein